MLGSLIDNAWTESCCEFWQGVALTMMVYELMKKIAVNSNDYELMKKIAVNS
jgi:hypothetical protein